jgi:hypothetical protein
MIIEYSKIKKMQCLIKINDIEINKWNALFIIEFILQCNSFLIQINDY